MALRRRPAIWLAVCGVLVLAFSGFHAASASAANDFTLLKEFGPDGTSGGEFSSASAVAVDEVDGVLYVLDSEANALYKFDLKGNPVDFGGGSPSVSGNKLSGLSVDEAHAGERQVAVNPTTHVVYFAGQADNGSAKAIQAFHSNGDPAVFSATGTNEIVGSPNFFRVLGLAVDQNGAIYASDGGSSGNGIQVYDESGAIVYSSSGAGDSLAAAGSVFANIAVDSAGTLYALKESHAAKYLPSEYPVTSATTYSDAGIFDPNEAPGIAVDRQTDDVYVAESAPAPRVARFDSDGASLGAFAGPGEKGALKAPQGIAATSVEGQAFAFVADSPVGGPSRVKIFEEEICLCPPEIVATSVSAVSGDSAILRATIKPGNLDTAYRFEYGLVDCAVGPCEEAPLGGGSIAAGKNDVKVSAALTGLQPATTYYFRVVAENSAGVEPGPSMTFTTQASGLGGALPDGRAWEMVSPAEKFGGVIISTRSTAIQAASSGGKLAYASAGSLFEEPASNRPPEPTSVLAKRGPGGVWASKDLAPPHEEASVGLHAATEFKLFTPDLGQAVMEPNEDLPTPSLHTPYLWSDGDPPSLVPFVESEQSNLGAVVEVVGASRDLAHIAVRSKVAPLVPGAELESVYMWSGGALEAVSELPESEGGDVIAGTVGTGQGSVRHAISGDGSRVFWTSTNGDVGKAGLYLRDRSAGESMRLDVKEAGASGAGDNRPAFSGARADGSVVFFTDTQHLTAGASPAGRDLYRCEIGDVGGGALGCVDLTDISAPLPGSGESSGVIDQLPALSEDGTRLFFVARGVLDEEPNEAGEVAEPGEPNLYLWEEGQAPRLVAVLAEEDGLVWGEASQGGFAVNISAAISPNGRYFAFTSEKSLTGYENRNAADQPNSEVFLYDTEAQGDRLACLSCNPTGAIAVGEQIPKEPAFFPPDPGGIWAGRWVAATLPQATETLAGGPSLYRPRAVLDNGRAFFNSVDPLVAADSNGDWDVYQYQPLGVGSCSAKTNGPTATRSGGGCVALLSSGSSEGDSGFLDASASGEDVFFLTRTRLSVLDRDEEMDVYDARVNGIPAVLHPVRECAGEACQPSLGAPNDPTPSSESFKGAQTPLHCRKGQKKVRRHGKPVCVRKKKKHPKHKKHKQKPAQKSGRASR